MTPPLPDQPPPDLAPETIENLAPALDKRVLWMTLLAPGLLTVLGMIALLASGGNEMVMNVGLIAVLIALVGSWVAFIKCISKRLVGASLILLILAYPVVQAVLIFTVFFAGCLVLINQSGFY